MKLYLFEFRLAIIGSKAVVCEHIRSVSTVLSFTHASGISRLYYFVTHHLMGKQ